MMASVAEELGEVAQLSVSCRLGHGIAEAVVHSAVRTDEAVLLTPPSYARLARWAMG